MPYERTPRERSVVAAHIARRDGAKPVPQQIVEKLKGGVGLRYDHPDQAVGTALTMEALGLAHVGELAALLQQVVDLTQKDRAPDAGGINAMISQIAAIAPSDGVESMLAAQMVAVHNATMKVARVLRGSETIQQQDSASNAMNKLARTFTGQLDALKRYRSKGEQKVTVEHVTVNHGGQAIVGNVKSEEGGA